MFATLSLVCSGEVGPGEVWEHLTPGLRAAGHSATQIPREPHDHHGVFTAALEHVMTSRHAEGMAAWTEVNVVPYTWVDVHHVDLFKSEYGREVDTVEKRMELVDPEHAREFPRWVDQPRSLEGAPESVGVPPVPVRWSLRTGADVFDSEGSWKAWYESGRSGGIFALSPIVPDREGKRALVYVEHRCGGLCGTGRVLLLSEDGGRWFVIEDLRLWVS